MSEQEQPMKLGAKFWLAVVAGAIACGIAALVLLALLENAWLRWGFFGMLLGFAGLLILFGWIFDRRAKQHRQDLAEAAREQGFTS